MEVTTDVNKIKQAENTSKSAEALAVNVLLVMFTEDEPRNGNCTTSRRADIALLVSEQGVCRKRYA